MGCDDRATRSASEGGGCRRQRLQAQWTKTAFNTAWRRARPDILRERGLVFHGLRKSAVVTLIEAGCSTAEVAAITGQSMQMVEHYARARDQRRLAIQAMQRWENEG